MTEAELIEALQRRFIGDPRIGAVRHPQQTDTVVISVDGNWLVHVARQNASSCWRVRSVSRVDKTTYTNALTEIHESLLELNVAGSDMVYNPDSPSAHGAPTGHDRASTRAAKRDAARRKPPQIT